MPAASDLEQALDAWAEAGIERALLQAMGHEHSAALETFAQKALLSLS